MTARPLATLLSTATTNLADNTSGQISAADVRDSYKDLVDSAVLFVTPQMYGAVGDGVTNDTAAFNLALATGAAVYVPAATYLLNALTQLTANSVRLFGAGRTTILKFDTTGIGIDINTVTQSKPFIIQDLTFANVTHVPAAFIRNTNSLNGLIERCCFLDCAATACIENVTGYGTTIADCVFHSVTGSAIKLNDNGAAPEYSSEFSIYNCDITGITGNGITTKALSNLRIQDTILENISGKALSIDPTASSGQAWQIVLDQVYFESNTGTDIELLSNGSYWCVATLIGCSFVGTPSIVLGSKSNVVIIGSWSSGGHDVTVTGSGSARLMLINSNNFIQSGTFDWLVIGGNQSDSILTSGSATAGIGYSTGAGGVITQQSNKSTTVVLDKVTGAITMNGAALNDATTVNFTLTSAAIAATDTIVVTHSSAGTAGAYLVSANAIAAGSCKISVRNVSGGALSEAIVLTYCVWKGTTT